MFSAFTVESYVNKIGERVIPSWDEFERLAWRKKIILIHDIKDRKADWGCEPLRFAPALFKLRDNMAHGKSIRTVGREALTLEEGTRAFEQFRNETAGEPEWVKQLTLPFLMALKVDVLELMNYLSVLGGLPAGQHGLTASGSLLIDGKRLADSES